MATRGSGDLLDGIEHDRAVIANAGLPQREAEIEGPDLEDVVARHRRDLVEAAQRLAILDDRDDAARPVRHVAGRIEIDRAVARVAGGRALPARAERRELRRRDHLLELRPTRDVGDHHHRRTKREPVGHQVRIGTADLHDRQRARRVGRPQQIIHPAGVKRLDLRAEDDEVQAGEPVQLDQLRAHAGGVDSERDTSRARPLQEPLCHITVQHGVALCCCALGVSRT